MKSESFGRIINIGTNLVQNPVVPYHDYTIAKAALLGLTRTFAKDLGPDGITVNMLSRSSLWQFEVNLDKTKIVIFSRGKVRKHTLFKFRGSAVEVVPEYIYLGVTVSYNNHFIKAIDKQLTLARKALFAMLAKADNLKLSIDLQ